MITVTWKVDDGYINNGPHQTIIDEDDLEGLDDAEREAFIEDAVQSDFVNIVSWHILNVDK